jgi:site-specific DNA recombinase
MLDSNKRDQIQTLHKELSKFTKIDTLTPELLHRLIERIEFKADGSARIFYRFSVPSAIIYRNFSNTHTRRVRSVCGNT